jgi:UDPglucose 6-dehydrogenase
LDIAIVGFGTVGKHLERLSVATGMCPVVYDKALGPRSRSAVNACGASFICVPTNQGSDGRLVLDDVRDVLEWLKTPIVVIRSTLPIGATRALSIEFNRPLVYVPEYIGETPWAPQRPEADFVVLGSPDFVAAREVLRLLQSMLGPEPVYRIVEPEYAELAKLMENSFLALKVTFANEMAGTASAFELDYEAVRELWLLDGRMGRSHTIVTEEGGFAGKCLPKDLHNLICQAEDASYRADLLIEVERSNRRFRSA